MTQRKKNANDKIRHGIPCPKCNSTITDVIDTRPSPYGYLRRRRKCQKCEHRFSTQENTIIKGGAVREKLRDFLVEAEFLVQKYQNMVDKE